LVGIIAKIHVVGMGHKIGVRALSANYSYALCMNKDALKKLKKQYEQKSKEVLRDIDALGKYESKGDAENAELIRRRIRKGAVDATALLRQVGTLLPTPK
jgi:hypothetical protein